MWLREAATIAVTSVTNSRFLVFLHGRAPYPDLVSFDANVGYIEFAICSGDFRWFVALKIVATRPIGCHKIVNAM